MAIAILPEDCWIMKCESPTESPPVEMVEVATVLVALKFPNVGVEVAMRSPLPLRARSEELDIPENVTDDVAKRFAVVTVPPSK